MKHLAEFVLPTDEVPVHKLKISDQLRYLLYKLSNRGEQLKADSEVEQYKLSLQADLSNIIFKYTERLRKGQHHSVTFQIPSVFRPVLYDVLDSKAYMAYNYTVKEPPVSYGADYFIDIRMEVKSIESTH